VTPTDHYRHNSEGFHTSQRLAIRLHCSLHAIHLLCITVCQHKPGVNMGNQSENDYCRRFEPPNASNRAKSGSCVVIVAFATCCIYRIPSKMYTCSERDKTRMTAANTTQLRRVARGSTTNKRGNEQNMTFNNESNTLQIDGRSHTLRKDLIISLRQGEPPGKSKTTQ
jgi:hypothetical protein